MNVQTVKRYIWYLCATYALSAHSATDTQTSSAVFEFQRVTSFDTPLKPTYLDNIVTINDINGTVWTISRPDLFSVWTPGTVSCTPVMPTYTGYYAERIVDTTTVTSVKYGQLTSKCKIEWMDGNSIIGSSENGSATINTKVSRLKFTISVYDANGARVRPDKNYFPPNMQVARVGFNYTVANYSANYSHTLVPVVEQIDAVQKTTLTFNADDKGVVTGNSVTVRYMWTLEQTGPTLEYSPLKALTLYVTQRDAEIPLTLKDTYYGEREMTPYEKLPVTLSTSDNTGSGNIEFVIRERPGFGTFNTKVELQMEWN